MTVSEKKKFKYENDDSRHKNGRQTVKNQNLSKPWTNLRGLVPRKLYTKFEENPDDGFGEEEVLSSKSGQNGQFRPKNGRQTAKMDRIEKKKKTSPCIFVKNLCAKFQNHSPGRFWDLYC